LAIERSTHALQAKATFQDLVEGHAAGLNKTPLLKAMVVCNTKLSGRSRRYANCAQIDHICWRSPPAKSLERLIEERRLYPITMLKMLDRERLKKFSDAGILLLRELSKPDLKELSERTRIRTNERRKLIQKSAEVAKQAHSRSYHHKLKAGIQHVSRIQHLF